MSTTRPIYCCVPIEFIQPWDQNEAIRKVKELGLGNVVMVQGTFHIGNSEEARRQWRDLFPHLAERIDAVPRFPERPEHGMCALLDLPVDFRLEQVELCRQLGLLMFGWMLEGDELTPQERARLRRAGEGMVLSEPFMCENLSILGATLPAAKLREIDARPVVGHSESLFAETTAEKQSSVFDDPESLDFQVMHDWFVARFREHGRGLRAQWGRALTAIEASPQMHLALEAGADVPIFELVPSEPLRGLAATRGAAAAYGKDLWGIHTAMGYYRAPTDRWTPERLRIAYDLYYAGGASFFSEPNIALCNWGSCSGFFTIAGSPAIRWAEEECRPFDDPICARGREVLAEHYRFTQFHTRPAGGPRVRLGYVLGNLDAWTGSGGTDERMWLVDHPGFLAPEALATWRHFDRIFESEPWYIPPTKCYWQADAAKPLYYGTPPCGQVDLVPAEAPLDRWQGYGTLVFLGWNTMTEALYAKLTAFVENGGTLFLAVPHLDTRARTDRPHAFLRHGDVSALCGVRILGAGAEVEEVFLAEQTGSPRHVMPQGTLYLEVARLAQLDLCGARVLAHPRGKPEHPVLLEHRIGKGTVYLLATWDYAAERFDALITDILRTLAEGEQAEIAVAGRDVFYAIYDGTLPSGQSYSTVYLVNHDIYGQPAYPELTVREGRVPVRVGSELRIVWVLDGLVLAPLDRFVQVVDACRHAEGWVVTLESVGARPDGSPDDEREIQIEVMSGAVASIALDGQPLALEGGREGDNTVRCRLSGRNVLRIERCLRQ